MSGSESHYQLYTQRIIENRLPVVHDVADILAVFSLRFLRLNQWLATGAVLCI